MLYFKRRFALSILVLSFFLAQNVRAGGLNVFARIEDSYHRRLTPVSQSFRTCFKADGNRNPTVGICAENSKRKPASKKKLRRRQTR